MDPFVKAPRSGQGVVATLLAAMATLSACGGGGGGGGTDPAPPAPPTAPTSSTPIAAQLSVPSPVGYDAERLAAFNRLNEIRLSAGLGMLAQNVLMDQAAQAHAEWMVANDSFTHEEVDGTIGFTGAHWWDRVETLGYVPIAGGEVIAAPVHGAAGVDALVNVVYHRSGMLAFEPLDVGIGWSNGSASKVSMPLVIDISRPGTDIVRGVGQAAQATINGVAVWPIEGAGHVPLRLGMEIPNPIPTQDVLSLGTPVSVEVEETSTLTVETFTLTDGKLGLVVPTKVLTRQNDPNGLLPASFVAAVPLSALSPNTTYIVKFSGSALELAASAPTSIRRTWSFATASQ